MNHRLASALALSVLSASAFASTTVYTSSASFMAQVNPGAYTETFTGLGDTPPTAFSGGGFSYSVTAPDGTFGGGDVLGTGQIDQALTISFTSGNVFAVGGNFFSTNINSVFQSVHVTVGLNDGTSVSFTPATFADSYRGFVSTVAITSLTISAPGQSLYASVDNLTVGASLVPEPSTWALAAIGMLGVAGAVRRRRA